MKKQKNDSDINSNYSLKDENYSEIEDTKKSLISLLDKEIKQKKQNFLDLSKLSQTKEQIQILSQNLKLDIRNLEQIISNLLDKQKDEYLNAFSQFMDSIRKNLTMQLEEMEKAFEEKRKTNDIRVIRCERDFFKSEAIRLSNLCKKLKEELEEINFKFNLVKHELTNVKIKYKETENINKKLLSDIENKFIQKNKSKSYGDKNINLKSNNKYLSITTENNNDDSSIYKNTKNISSIKVDNSFDKEKEKNSSNISINQGVTCLNNLLKKSKNETKKVKEKANKAIAELSKIYLQKNKLENIFQNCVEETKKIIFNRKIMENKFYKIKNRKGLFKYDHDHRINYKIKFKDFLPSDKQKTLEQFIFDDEVYNIVKDIIFKLPKMEQNEEISKNINKMNTLHFSGTESKLKRLSDIPKIRFAKKNIAILPLMSNEKLNFISKNARKNEDIHKFRSLTINK